MNKLLTSIAMSAACICMTGIGYGFEITRSTVDGGGGRMSSISFTLTGTVGQPDAETNTGGIYTLTGGFHSAATTAPPKECIAAADCDDALVCTFDSCGANICSNSPALYGDVAGLAGCGPDGVVDLFDIIAILDGFSGNSVCALSQVDIAGSQGACTPDGVVNIFDVLNGLNVSQGAVPCDCSGDGAPIPQPPGDALTGSISQRQSGTVVLTLSPRSRSVKPGGTLWVDVFASGAGDVRGYQFAVSTTGGDHGELKVTGTLVEDDRSDYLFTQTENISAEKTAAAMVIGMYSDVSLTDRSYLGTVALRATKEAVGVFELKLKLKSGRNTMIVGAQHLLMPIQFEGPIVIDVR